MKTDVKYYWWDYAEIIGQSLKHIIDSGLPDGEDFLWIILHPQDLTGMPMTVNPATSDQQINNDWEHENILQECVPRTVQLPDEFTATPHALDTLKESTAEFLFDVWNRSDIHSPFKVLFSLNDDGWFYDLEMRNKISAWDIKNYLINSKP